MLSISVWYISLGHFTFRHISVLCSSSKRQGAEDPSHDRLRLLKTSSMKGTYADVSSLETAEAISDL